MASSRLPLLLCSIFVHSVATTIAQPEVLFHLCIPNENYTTNDTYNTNLRQVLSSIYTNTEIDYGFYNFSYGEQPDQVNAIALCRGDIETNACRDCLNYSSLALTSLCPIEKEAIIGFDNCILRYSNRYIFNLIEVAPYFWVYNTTNVTNVEGFNSSRASLLDRLRDEAALGGSSQKFAKGQIAAPNFQTIYAIAQCTPDLSESECRYCLYNASALIRQCCVERSGGRIINPSCNFRYEINRFFYDFIDVNAPPPSQSTSQGKGSDKTRTVIIVVVSLSVFFIIIVFVCVVLRIRTPRKEYQTVDEIESVKSLQFDFATISAATDDFANDKLLGQGGFGAVYKGMLLDGQEIAVKRLSRSSGQGDIEFKNEVLLVAKLQHRNLVRLLGFCLEGQERLLIYEFVPNSSLDHFIFNPTKSCLLNWEMRYKIIGGIARGLLYLHEDSRFRIIHRDLKASNILLDTEMNPKIADFGMARLFDLDQTQGDTNRIVGTFGYMAPEYVRRGHFSVKSDVFSFGVLVLEIVSSQKNSSFRNGENPEDLLTYAWECWNEGRTSSLIDPTLRSPAANEIMRCIHIGLLCVQENMTERPSMASVVVMLTSHSVTLAAPSKPGFFIRSNANPDDDSHYIGSARSNYTGTGSENLSVNEASITELDPR